ncbi:MAG: hypothetical protein HQL46_10140 [Gammaproteobacteria bacterium]|nr:hypothetical protein [Gammaproteobacteria bacterium]
MKLSLLKKIIEIKTSTIAMEIKDNTAIIDSLREYGSQSGEPVYIWKKMFGLYRTDLPHVALPSTQTYKQTLKYINKNNTGHVFALIGFNEYLNDADTIYILKTIKTREDYKNKILLIDQKVEIPSALKGKIMETKKFLRYKQKTEV